MAQRPDMTAGTTNQKLKEMYGAYTSLCKWLDGLMAGYLC